LENIGKLAEEVRRGLEQALPGMRKTILKKLPLAVAAMIEARTPNTSELASVLPLATERADMREQWLRRLLDNSLLEPGSIVEPLARQALQQASADGQTVLLSMDQTDLGDRFAVLMLSVGVGERSLPLAKGARERYEVDARLFEAGIVTSIGVLHEPGHPKPWIIAMDQPPNRASVLDYSARWAIEPMFSDFKTRGFRLESTQSQAPERLDRLMLIMALAMYWCVNAGRADALKNPTPTEKKRAPKPISSTGAW
jgi:hypothetical protein